MNLRMMLAAVAVTAVLPFAAQAQTIYSNPYAQDGGGDCLFNTTCAAQLGAGDDFAAQMFTLTAAATVTSASFTTLDQGGTGSGANWAFYDADGAGGLPGTLVASGSSPLSSIQNLGSDVAYNLDENFFNVSPVALGAGSYYFALQYVTPVFENYLGDGTADSGAAETKDGGATWTPTYEDTVSVAVALFGSSSAAPEPAAWALMLMGFGSLGAVLRANRRRLALA
jgi:PEP-CTERM motif